MGWPSLQENRSSGEWAFLLAKGRGAKLTLPTDGHLLKPKCNCPFVSSRVPQHRTGNILPSGQSITQSICFVAGLTLWKPHGKDGAAGPPRHSEQRAWGTRYPTAPRSQTPFPKEREQDLRGVLASFLAPMGRGPALLCQSRYISTRRLANQEAACPLA